jgi:adenylosuccinate lyase
MTVDPERMRANLELTHGALFSQRVLLALVAGGERQAGYGQAGEGEAGKALAGMTRDEAYRIVQELAQRAFDEGISLRELLAGDERAAGLDLDAIFDYGHFTRYAREIVGRLDAIAPASDARALQGISSAS